MKKILILLCGTLLFATSCLSGGGSAGSAAAEYTGALTVIDATTSDLHYKEDKAKMVVEIPNMLEPKLDILFEGIKFSQLMPKMNIEIAGIPFSTTISEDENSLNYIFEAKNIVPTAGSVEYEKFEVGYIKGYIGKTAVEVEFTIPSEDKKVLFSTKKEETAPAETEQE